MTIDLHARRLLDTCMVDGILSLVNTVAVFVRYGLCCLKYYKKTRPFHQSNAGICSKICGNSLQCTLFIFSLGSRKLPVHRMQITR